MNNRLLQEGLVKRLKVGSSKKITSVRDRPIALVEGEPDPAPFSKATLSIKNGAGNAQGLR